MDKREDYKFLKIRKQELEHFNDSHGFDSKTAVSLDVGNSHQILMPLKLSNPDDTLILKNCKAAVQIVLDHLEKLKEKNLEPVRVIKAYYGNLEPVRVIKAYYGASHMFFVTFKAKNKVSGIVNNYQSVISHEVCDDGDIVHIFTELHMFRRMRSKEGAEYTSQEDDEADLYFYRKKKEVVQTAPVDKRKNYKFLEIRNCGVQEFEHLDDYLNYEKYAKELNDSQGFDCKTVVSPDVGDTERMLMPLNLSNPAETLILKNCKEAVQIVLDHHEDLKEKDLELVRVMKANYRANYRASYMFFVTFKAKKKVSGTVNTYQSVIFHEVRNDGDFVHNFTELHMFRRVRSKKGAEKRTSDSLNKEQRKKQGKGKRKTDIRARLAPSIIVLDIPFTISGDSD